jgi:TetR/AcrR family transcriptional repressor of nem operon
MAIGTRDRILAVAARLFHDQGFEATGVATILRDAGVNSGSLYHFFPGKDALLVGVLERHRDSLRPTFFEPAERASADPIERVFRLLEQYRKGLEASGGRPCPIGNLAFEVGGRNPQVQALIDGYFSGWVERVRIWLDEAGDRLPANLDRAALARLVLTVMEGGIMQAQASGTPEPFDASVAQLRGYLALLQQRTGEISIEEPGLPIAPQVAAAEEEVESIDHSAWRAW